jgi:hypothetical protein
VALFQQLADDWTFSARNMAIIRTNQPVSRESSFSRLILDLAGLVHDGSRTTFKDIYGLMLTGNSPGTVGQVLPRNAHSLLKDRACAAHAV